MNVLLAVVIFVLGAACARPPDGAQPSGAHESQPAWGQLPATDPSALPEAVRGVHALDAQLEGFWHLLQEMDELFLEVRRIGDDSFDVLVTRNTDVVLEQPTVRTSARWIDGGLALEPSVRFLRVLYPIRVQYPRRPQPEECLLPDCFLENLRSGRLWVGDEYAFRRCNQDQVVSSLGVHDITSEPMGAANSER